MRRCGVELANQRDGTLAITVAPLWSKENPLERDWHNLREKLLAADTPNCFKLGRIGRFG